MRGSEAYWERVAQEVEDWWEWDLREGVEGEWELGFRMSWNNQ